MPLTKEEQTLRRQQANEFIELNELTSCDIKEFVNTYFKHNKEDNEYYSVLPVKDYKDKQGKTQKWGTKSSFELVDFYQLATTHKVIGKGKDGTDWEQPIKWEDAEYIEIRPRLNNANKTMCIIDFDGWKKGGDVSIDELIEKPEFPEELKDSAFFLSRTKSLPHFIFWVDGLPKNIKLGQYIGVLKDFEGDILFNHAWERVDNLLYNVGKNCDLNTIHYDTICNWINPNNDTAKKLLPKKPVKATTSPGVAPQGVAPPGAEGPTKNRAILEKGMHLLKPYAGSGKYGNWTRIIWAIKNLTNDKNLAMTFSKLDETSFDETSFDAIWDNSEARDNSLGIRSIINFMRQTNKEETDRILNEVNEGVSIEYLFKHSPLKNGIFDKYVAQHFHMVFKNKVITVRESTYVYNGIFWELSDKTLSALQVLISGKFINHLNKFWDYTISKYSDEMASTTEEDKREAIQLKITLVSGFRNSLAGKLMTQFGRKDYVKEIILYSIDNDIEFDQKSNLFVFKNCIFDLITQKKVEPNPLDYMSICCGYDYDDKYDKGLEKELLSVIKSIHQNEEIFEYFMTVMATALTSEHLQYFIILTGKGGNGKGLLMKLYNTMLGEYAYTLPVQVLLNDIKLGPNPEVANMNGKRLCSTSEPKKGERIRSATMKALTGERTIGARKLQSNDCKTIMNNTLIMEVNEFAGFDETGDAITRRVRSIPFLSSAVSKAEYEQAENKDNLTIKNTSYDTEEWRMKYRQALFTISLPFLDKFYKLGKDLPEMPKACIDKTNAHLALSDDLHLWIKELYIEDEDNYEIIPLKHLYDTITKNDAFRELPKTVKRQYKYSYFCDKMQENKTMRDFVVEKKKRYKNKGEQIQGLSLCGWRLRTEEDS
jgi:phage/plasmid-associated DNA primase